MANVKLSALSAAAGGLAVGDKIPVTDVSASNTTAYGTIAEIITLAAVPAPASTVSTQAFGDTGTVGTGATYARNDHKHVMPANITTTTLGLNNVTNESKATMFTNPEFTGTINGITVNSTTHEVSNAGSKIRIYNTATTALTLALSDAGTTILMEGSGNGVAIPAAGTVAFPVGTVINFVQTGSVQVAFTITTDTLLSGTDNSKKKLTAKGSAASLIKVSATSGSMWWLVGDIAA